MTCEEAVSRFCMFSSLANTHKDFGGLFLLQGKRSDEELLVCGLSRECLPFRLLMQIRLDKINFYYIQRKRTKRDGRSCRSVGRSFFFFFFNPYTVYESLSSFVEGAGGRRGVLVVVFLFLSLVVISLRMSKKVEKNTD